MKFLNIQSRQIFLCTHKSALKDNTSWSILFHLHPKFQINFSLLALHSPFGSLPASTMVGFVIRGSRITLDEERACCSCLQSSHHPGRLWWSLGDFPASSALTVCVQETWYCMSSSECPRHPSRELITKFC